MKNDIQNRKPDLISPRISGQQNKIILVLGKKGRGKTQLISTVFLPKLVKERLIVFDPHGEYNQRELLRANSLDQLHDFLIENYNYKPWALVWTPRRMSEIEYFLDICYQMHECWIILEECNMRGVLNVREPSPIAIDLVNFGRNKEISLICAAKRPAQVNRELTAQADIIISFRQDEPNDIKYLKEFCGPDVETVTAGLQGHEWAIVYPLDAENNA